MKPTPMTEAEQPKPVMGNLFVAFSTIYGANGAVKLADCTRKEYAAELVRRFNLFEDMQAVLRDELSALEIWATADDVPDDVQTGIAISRDKITRVLDFIDKGIA